MVTLRPSASKIALRNQLNLQLVKASTALKKLEATARRVKRRLPRQLSELEEKGFDLTGRALLHLEAR